MKDLDQRKMKEAFMFILAKQLLLQNDHMGNDRDKIASSAFLQMNVLALLDEIFEFGEALQAHARNATTHEETLLEIRMEFADIILFLLNLALWMMTQGGQQLTMSKVVTALMRASERRGDAGDPVRLLRDFVRSTPWKPWKKNQEFKGERVLERFEQLASAVFGLAEEFDLDLEKIESIYDEKAQIVERRARGNY